MRSNNKSDTTQSTRTADSEKPSHEILFFSRRDFLTLTSSSILASYFLKFPLARAAFPFPFALLRDSSTKIEGNGYFAHGAPFRAASVGSNARIGTRKYAPQRGRMWL